MRSRHDPAYLVYRDMIRDCEDGDEHACRYLIDHDAAEHIQPEQHVDTFPLATVMVGAVVAWLLVMALLGIGI
jgi:hypothetical protein